MRGGKRKGSGAPKKETKRDKAITIRLTEAENIAIAQAARKLGKTKTQFIVDAALKGFD